MCFVVCLREQLVVDLPGDVSPGLHHLPTLLPPDSVSVHPLAMSATPPDPGLWTTLKARQIVVVNCEVPVVDRKVLRNCNA